MALDQYKEQEVNKPSAEKGTESRPAVIDTENGTPRRFGTGSGHVGGRIAPVLPHLKGYDFGDDESGSEILGKQIELEAGNALQYRTCTWQKVGNYTRAQLQWCTCSNLEKMGYTAGLPKNLLFFSMLLLIIS